MFMWIWRAFIFSLSIALFAVISSPARALDDSIPTHHYTVNVLADLHYDVGDIDNTDTYNNDISLTQALLSNDVLHNDENSDVLRDNKRPNKTPAYQVRFNPNISLPAFERQAASVFGSTSQNEPIFVLAYEFQPEILGLRHFLAPLNTDNAVPWYLRSDAANSHGRVAGWKDGNTLYTGTITYLS
jgi:hypothetical protein